MPRTDTKRALTMILKEQIALGNLPESILANFMPEEQQQEQQEQPGAEQKPKSELHSMLGGGDAGRRR